MQVTSTLGEDDYRAYYANAASTLPVYRRNRLFLLFVGPVIGLIAAVLSRAPFNIQILLFAAIAIAGVIAAWMYPTYVASQAMKSLNNSGRLDEPNAQTIVISETGVEQRSTTGSGRVGWDGVARLAETPTHLFVYLASNQGLILPKDSFDDPEDADRFAGTVRGYLAGAKRT